MFKNYLKIAWRNLHKNKVYSFINIGGLAVGMAVIMTIGLWIHGELSYNKSYKNYAQIAQVYQNQNFNGKLSTQISVPPAMGDALNEDYGSSFKHVIMSSWNGPKALSYENDIFLKEGNYYEPEITEMLALNMIYGARDGLKELNSIMLSQTVAEALFHSINPVGKLLKVSNQFDVKVTGVYEDLPIESSFGDLTFILPWSLYLSQNTWINSMQDPWGSNFAQTYVQLADNMSMIDVSERVKEVKLKRIAEAQRKYNPSLFLHPMSKWYLHGAFEDGLNIGGRIDNVWLFGIIGIFVLILACINFINLSTARSEKRAKEVGIRKVIGSRRQQLIAQFFSESVFISLFAFVFSILLVALILPYFNRIAESEVRILWEQPLFWAAGICFSLFTGLIAGIYPAVFLSSFRPVKVLKGVVRSGKYASIPRKVLVVSQFSISIILIVGTLIVYEQIKHAQDRPLGYDKNGLITINTNEITHNHYDEIRNKLINKGAIVDMCESLNPMTQVWNSSGGIEWKGKDPNLAVDFPNSSVSYDFGNTIGWNIKEGRDFSRDFGTDSSALIVNEAAVEFMNLEDPIGETIIWDQNPYTIIGVAEDMLVQSPYKPVRPSMYNLTTDQENLFILKLNPAQSVQESMSMIEAEFKAQNPAIPFVADFVDDEFSDKFSSERTIGNLAILFTFLAIFISSLGLFGLASFVAEQRTKEIGIRKILGATVAKLWQMLSKDFVLLVVYACALAIPIAYYLMNNWLLKFDYHTAIPWWAFGVACLGALAITLLTVSFQAIKAAVANPIKSLRTE